MPPLPLSLLLLQSNKPDQTAVYALMALGVLGLVYISIVRPLRNKKKDPLDHTPARTSLAQQRAVERDMGNLLVELQEMSRRMTAALDTRTAKLEMLIQDADERIEKLSALRGAAGGPPPAEHDALGALRAGGGLTPESASRPSVTASAPAPWHAQVYDLADQGHSPREIAQQVGRPSGEVELILALRDKR